MAVPETIIKLIERFDFHRQSHISSRDVYNETKLRQDYLDHVFIALGWDVYNTQGWSEQAREVSLEQPIKILGTTDFIDYSFKIGKDLKFIAEAKAPRVRIKDNTNAAYQVRRYAWNATLSLCLLTNFDEFAVYDCTKRPSSSNAAAVARIEYFTYKDLPAKWDWLVSVFSKDAVFKGSFDRFAESTRSKKRTASVDDDILTEIENWRDALAKNIALRNTSLSVEELNYSVQTIIDRIIFLRICEDRGLEQNETLKALLDLEDVYLHLCDLFRRADTKYNSGIFYFAKEPDREEPDTLTLTLKVDDKVLKGIIKRLYYPESPYEFSVIPTAILGHVYEQFLGKIIRLTEGHQARVEYKPEVKKAGGVFYTPQYIVEYIVRHTVEELVKGKTPREVSQIRILDPACGSGSFLLGAYQSLLDWHLEWYIQNLASLLNMKVPVTDAKVQALLPELMPKKKKSAMPVELPIYPTGYSNGIKKLDRTRSDWALSTTEKKRILLNNIYGVDIDHQAVEVTKLSLLLKVLEGENEQNIDKQLKLCDERALPSLHQNIKCGNSLIGTDILTPEMPPEEVKRINPFDWEREFADIMKAGGFDAVIGNPPYVRQESLKEQKRYFETRYAVYQGTADLYAYFIEKGISLLRPKGVFSYIVANKWMRANYGKPLRKFLLTKQIEEIIDFGDLPVFKTAITYPCILRVTNKDPVCEFCTSNVKALDFSSLDEYVIANWHPIDPRSLNDEGWALGERGTENLLKKMQNIGRPLGEYVNNAIYRGIITGLNEAFVIDEKITNKIIKKDPKSAKLIRPFLVGKDIKRYAPLERGKNLILMPKGWTNSNSGDTKNKWKWFKENYPAIAEHLEPFAESAEKRCDKGDYWWELRACEYYDEFEKVKIFYPDIAPKGYFTLDEMGNYYCANSGYFIVNNQKYLLGILNSQLITFYYSQLAALLRGGYLRFFTQDIAKLPIRTINFFDPVDKARHDRMVALVTQMLDLNKKLQDAKLDHEKTLLSRQIEATDAAIDKLVYELYGLTEEEIKIVGGDIFLIGPPPPLASKG
jgi:hypothetical protein